MSEQIRKKCAHCNEELELEAFDKKNTGKYGRQSVCRVCTKKKRQEKAVEKKAQKQALKLSQPLKHAPMYSDEYYEKMAVANEKKSETYSMRREVKAKQWAEMSSYRQSLSEERAMICKAFQSSVVFANIHNLWSLPQPHYELVENWNLLPAEDMSDAIKHLGKYWELQESLMGEYGRRELIELLHKEPGWFEKMEKLCQCKFYGKLSCPRSDEIIYKPYWPAGADKDGTLPEETIEEVIAMLESKGLL